MKPLSDRSQPLKQSGIRNASVRCAKIGGINLGQGVCDLPIEADIKQAAYDAIAADKSIYSNCQGVTNLRQAIAEKIRDFNHIPADPEKNIMVSHGSTGAFICAAMTLFNPGDEVILFEPFYGYHRNILELQNVVVKSVPINLTDFSIDMQQLSDTVTPQTKAIIICTPNNPSGKVYSQAELLAIGAIAKANDLYLITDEIYEYITYPGYEHISIASLEDFKERTVTISGFSKTYNMTGWRLGYACAPEHIIEKMALVQDLIYVCPNTPLQSAMLTALQKPADYYQAMRDEYFHKGEYVVRVLQELGFKVTVPQGAYYLLADFSQLRFRDDIEATNFLMEECKVATVTGSSFYLNPEHGKRIIRLCYAMQEDKVHQAMQQMQAKLG